MKRPGSAHFVTPQGILSRGEFMQATILLADDDPHIRELCELYLHTEGFTVHTTNDGQAALDALPNAQPDLLILDLMMPRLDGYEVCRAVRQQSDLPIIMLTARDDDVDKIVGLELGADDYITKPFNPRELVARVRAVLRRARGQAKPAESAEVLALGDLTVDAQRREVQVQGTPVQLRSKEFELLQYLLENRGLALSREQILEAVWGYDYYGETRTVDVHIAHLRKELSASQVQIETVWGVGYKLTGPDPATAGGAR